MLKRLHHIEPINGRSSSRCSSELLSSIRQCGDSRDLAEGRRLHAQATANGHDRSTVLGNLLVRMYGMCGCLQDAHLVFSTISRKNVFSWTIFLAAYAQNGHIRNARFVFEMMPQRDMVSWTSMISVYAQDGHMDHAGWIFVEMPERNLIPWNAIVTANAQNGHLSVARKVFDKMCGWSLVTCNSILQGYMQHGELYEAYEFFHSAPERDLISWNSIMQTRSRSVEDIKDTFNRMPQWDRVSFIALLSACVQSGEYEFAKAVYDEMPERNVASSTVMIQSYAQQGAVQEARNVFESMTNRDVVSWNTLVEMFTQNSELEDAQQAFDKMPMRNLVSFNIMLQGYSQSGEIWDAETLFCSMDERDVISWTAMVTVYGRAGKLCKAWETFTMMPSSNIVSWNALMNVYSENGCTEEVRLLFERIPQRNLVAWTTMVVTYAQNGNVQDAKCTFDQTPEQDTVLWTAFIRALSDNSHCELALSLFRFMDLEGHTPDRVTYTSVLQACSSLAVAKECKLIHSCIVETGYNDTCLGTSVINMYGKCGLLDEARDMLSRIPGIDIGSWTCMIVAYAQNGYVDAAVELFESLNLEGLSPDYITLVSVLCACSHGGMLAHGWKYFVSAKSDYDIGETLDQYLCMIGILGRAGQVVSAHELVVMMPFEPDVVAWMILLSACRSVGDTKRGAYVAERVFELEPENASAYLLLSNTHAVAGDWDGAAEVRRLMSEKGVRKRPGWSYLDFFLSDRVSD